MNREAVCTRRKDLAEVAQKGGIILEGAARQRKRWNLRFETGDSAVPLTESLGHLRGVSSTVLDNNATQANAVYPDADYQLVNAFRHPGDINFEERVSEGFERRAVPPLST